MFDPVKTVNRVIEYSFYLLFILVPLVVAPWNYELFEFNKMLVVYALTIIITGAWLIKIVGLRRIIFRRTFWDIPLIIFFLSQVASFLFSIDKHTSFWGYYGRFNGGLLSVICYLLLYWAFVSNLNYSIANSGLRISLITAAMVSIYGILEHFGHSFSCLLFTGKFDVACWVQDVQNRVFATLGQPNWLAAYLVALIPLTWAFALKTKKFLLFYSFTLLLYLCLLFTQSRSGFLAFVLSFLIFWGLSFWLNRQKVKKIFRQFIVISFLLLVTSLLFGTPHTPSLISQKQTRPPAPSISTEASQPLLISESSDIRRVVWKGAIEIWRHFPILGTGPETFAYSYYWFRPREHNDLSEWDFLYNKAHNEYLNYAATTGTVGLVSYLVLIGSFILYMFKKLKNQKLEVKNFALLSGFISIIVTNFFGFSVVITSLFFFLFPAFAEAASFAEVATKAKSAGKPAIASTNSKNISKKQWALIFLILLITSYLLIIITKYWLADKNYSAGEKYANANLFDQSFLSLQKAIKNRPSEPIYHDELALTSASLAVLANDQKNATLSTQLASLAIGESDKAIRVNPDNLNFWKNRTKVFYKMAQIDAQYIEQAFEALLHAKNLAPTDAKIKYNLALLYEAIGDKDMAIKTLEETIALKPNYQEAINELAEINKKQKN